MNKNISTFLNKLEDFKQLPSCWFNKKSNKISESAILNIAETLKKCDTIPETLFLAPLPEGGVRLEWEKDNASLSLECSEINEMFFVKLSEDSVEDYSYEDTSYSIKKAVNFIESGVI